MLNKLRIPLLFLLVTVFFSCRAPQMITISKVEGSKILKLDQTGIEMEVSLRIKNPNRIGFNIYRSSNLNATVNGLDLGRLKIGKRIHIGANSDDVHTFTLSSDFSKMGIADLPKLLTLGKSKSATIGIKGNLKVGKFFYKKSFDVDRTEKVSF
jgi:LEA14-like dessication related protein